MNTPTKNYCRDCRDVVNTKEVESKLCCARCDRVLRNLSESSEDGELARAVGFGTVGHKTKRRGAGW